jgi:hypothetical protein
VDYTVLVPSSSRHDPRPAIATLVERFKISTIIVGKQTKKDKQKRNKYEMFSI